MKDSFSVRSSKWKKNHLNLADIFSNTSNWTRDWLTEKKRWLHFPADHLSTSLFYQFTTTTCELFNRIYTNTWLRSRTCPFGSTTGFHELLPLTSETTLETGTPRPFSQISDSKRQSLHKPDLDTVTMLLLSGPLRIQHIRFTCPINNRLSRVQSIRRQYT